MKTDIEKQIQSLEKTSQKNLKRLERNKAQAKIDWDNAEAAFNREKERFDLIRPTHETALALYPDLRIMADGEFQSPSVKDEFDGIKFSDLRSYNLIVSPYKNISVNGKDIKIYPCPAKSTLIKYDWDYYSSVFRFTNWFSRTKFNDDVIRSARKEIVAFIDYKKSKNANVKFDFSNLDERVKKLLNFM